MVIVLNAKNKIGFIDGTLSLPPVNSFDDHAWQRCNNMVIDWLISSLDRYVAKSIMYFKTALEIRLDLEGQFEKTYPSQINYLQEKILNTFQEPDMSLATYFTRVKAIWDELDDLSPLVVCNCIPQTNFSRSNKINISCTFS